MSGSTGARPVGITIIAVLAFVAGAFGLLASLTIFGLGGGLAATSGLITLLIAVAEIALGYGFWMLKPWSWRLGLTLAIVNPAWEIARFLFRGADPLNLLIAIVFAAVWLYYLNLPSIRSAFGAPASGFPIIGHALDSTLSGKR
jgi:hypothetical protein